MLNSATVRSHRQAPTVHVRLPDGQPIGIRPVQARDAEEFGRAYTRLSGLSRQRRFLSVAPTLLPAEARYLTSVDHHEHVALVAVGPHQEILGSARYIRIPSRPGVAEMAIEVIDEWQRRGVGRALLAALSRHAQDAGVELFTAIVSTENVPMQRILVRAGASAQSVDGELEYTVAVGALRSGDRVQEALGSQGAHVHRRDVGFAEQTLDDRPELGLVGDNGVVFVVHRGVGAIGAQHARTGG